MVARGDSDDRSTIPVRNNLLQGPLFDQFADDELDLFVFYFAGHGFEAEEVGENGIARFSSYLVPVDGVAEYVGSEWKGIPETCVPLSAVTDRVGKLGAKQTVFILDVCREGGPLGLPRSFRDQAESIERAVILTGCDIGELSYEDGKEFQAGVFTHFLSEALMGRGDFAAAISGRVSIFDVHKYALEKVSEWAEIRQHEQHPQIWANQTIFLTTEHESIPSHLATPETRTQQIVNALSNARRKRRRQVDTEYCIRLIARCSSLAIADDEPTESDRIGLQKLLEQERDLISNLVHEGARLRAILTWNLRQQLAMPETPQSLLDSRMAQLKRYIESLLNDENALSRVEIVHLPVLAERNLLILDEDLFFEGRKLQITRLWAGAGFDATRVVKDARTIQHEISIFDELFENAAQFICREKDLSIGKSRNKGLLNVLLEDIENDLNELHNMTESD